MAEKIDIQVLRNGMVLLGEPMEGVQSVAFDFMIPAGASGMPENKCGVANIIEDWIFRGAGDKDSRQLSDAIDSLGVMRTQSVGTSHILIGGALEYGNLGNALELYADVINRPSLKDDEFESARQLSIDEVLSLEDDPRQNVMLKLRERFYPSPLGRSTLGEIDDLKQLLPGPTRQIITEKFVPSGIIFSVAGKYDFEKLCRQLEHLFSDRRKANTSEDTILQERSGKYTHINNDSAQLHIGLMTKTVRPMDEGYYDARIAVSVLSGGMSARLFTEVREKRGLCYAIGARYHSLKEAAGIMCYAGTTPEKGQQTYDVIIEQFRNLSNGISLQEIDTAKAGLKSALILQSESSGSRASSIASDFYMLGRVRSLDEIKDAIDATSVDSVLSFLEGHPFREFTAFTIGPVKLNVA